MKDHGSYKISSSDCSDDDECLENNDNKTGIEVPEINTESATSYTRDLKTANPLRDENKRINVAEYGIAIVRVQPGIGVMERVLEMSEAWKANALPKHAIKLFIVVLFASNHFAKHMEVQKHGCKRLQSSLQICDIIIFPFMDYYELVVLKTMAIYEFGIQNALTFEEWPEAIYPPYEYGPAYIISKDIVTFIISQHKQRRLRLFKMEDVSKGMWVERFKNIVAAVQYSHNWNLCQYGCMEGYFPAHYQSPRQMALPNEAMLVFRPCRIKVRQSTFD
ncbi:hypothetical protein VNO77_03720 [Canavalia gladiata]|uniref:Hexosyltransferase n=1 Tax=Canavalia gladiata TaxID=3824 RepID=A0AAN9MVD2_CANGL